MGAKTIGQKTAKTPLPSSRTPAVYSTYPLRLPLSYSHLTESFPRFSMHLGVQSGPCEEELIRLDEAYVQDKYKVGLLYCREGQQSEEEMYNNEEGGAAFKEFLDLIGQRVRLKDFNKYKGGLCNKSE